MVCRRVRESGIDVAGSDGSGKGSGNAAQDGIGAHLTMLNPSVFASMVPKTLQSSHLRSSPYLALASQAFKRALQGVLQCPHQAPCLYDLRLPVLTS